MYSKAVMELNALRRPQKYMGNSRKEAIIDRFISSNYNYCSLVWQILRVSKKNEKDSKTLS